MTCVSALALQVAYKIGRTMFETATLPKHLVTHCNQMDEIWVPTQFNLETFAASGVARSKLHVVPQGIDTSFFDPEPATPLTLVQLGAQLCLGSPHATMGKPYVFLAVFKWEIRKGWDVLLRAYFEEFTSTDNVELHILTHPFMDNVSNFKRVIREWVTSNMLFPDLEQLPKVRGMLVLNPKS